METHRSLDWPHLPQRQREEAKTQETFGEILTFSHFVCGSTPNVLLHSRYSFLCSLKTLSTTPQI